MNEQILLKHLGNRLVKNKNISQYFTLRMNTTAAYYFEAESIDDWIKVTLAAAESETPLFVLGGGSNIAVVHDLINALVVKNRYIKKAIIAETPSHAEVLFASAYPMSLVVKETVSTGLSGFEYHLGLPGTLGGAIYMNSKWTHPESYCGDSLIRANILSSDGKIKQVDRSYFHFGYDYSILQKTKEIFLDGVFRLKKVSPEILKKRSEEALEYRKKTQPFGVHTSGCFFQNISEDDKIRLNLPTTSSGYLIDQSGLKGTRLGTFEISEKHANFIINHGSGKPSDLSILLEKIKSTVKNKFGIVLKEEVVVV